MTVLSQSLDSNNLLFLTNQSIPSAITWDGTPPGGTKTEIYSWQKIGKYVFVDIRLKYQNSGSNNTSVTIDLPSEMPTPLNLIGVSDNEIMISGSGQGYIGNMQSVGLIGSCGIYKSNTSVTGYQMVLKGLTNIAAVGAIASFKYLTI